MAYPGGQSGNIFSPHWDDIFDIWYSFDEVTEQHGYHEMYFYSTAAAFRTDDTDGSMIERTITFVP
jgi:acyl-homoserine lactone acylase PvdQ